MPNPEQKDIEFIDKNIGKEDKTDEILKLVENGAIDPNEYLFYNMNLFHYAARWGNLTLTKALYENSLVNVNKKTNDGYPILVLLVNAYSSKIEPVLSFLLDKENVDKSATNELGFTASAWAERNKNYLLLQRLLKLEPTNTIAHIFYNIKMTCLKFGLNSSYKEKGITIDSKKLPNSYRTMFPEGYLVEGTVPDLQESFESFLTDLKNKTIVDNISKEDLDVLTEVNESLQNYTIYNILSENQFSKAEQLYNDFQKNKMICIHGSANSHAASVVIDGDIVYACNKGLGKHPDFSIVKYQATKPKELDDYLIQALLTSIFPQEKTALKELNGIKGKIQYVGNCTVASPKTAIHAMIWNVVTKKYPNFSDFEQKEKAKLLYKKWTAWDRTNQIKLLVESCHDIPEVFVALLKCVIYDTARFSPQHKKLAEALVENIPKKIFKKDFEENVIQNSMSLFLNDFEELSIKQARFEPKKPFNFNTHYKKILEFMQAIDLQISTIHPTLEKYDILFAIASGDNEKLTKLLETNKNLKEDQKKLLSLETGNRNLSCMHFAVLWNNEQALCELIRCCPEYINSKNKSNWTPLHYAIRSGNLGLIEILLKNDADQTLSVGSKYEYSVEKIIEEAIKDPTKKVDIKNMLKKYEKQKLAPTSVPQETPTEPTAKPTETEPLTFSTDTKKQSAHKQPPQPTDPNKKKIEHK